MYVIKQPKEVTLAVDIINKLTDKVMTAQQLSDELKEGHAFVQRIVYKLGKGGMIKVVRGPGGGVMLNPDVVEEDMTLGNVYRSLGRITEAEATSPGEISSALLLSILCKTPVIFQTPDAQNEAQPEEQPSA